MYHNELCNFPVGYLQEKKCDNCCTCWSTCTRKNSYEWEAYLKGLKHSKPTSNEQKQRELMDTRNYHYSELLTSIEEVNDTIKHMSGGRG